MRGDEETRFKKGQSGNPGGKPKWVKEVKEAAGAHSAEAVERLAYWMRSDNPQASIAATNAILDRAVGKPAQAIEHTGDATGFFDALAAALNQRTTDNGSGTEAGAPEGSGSTVQ